MDAPTIPPPTMTTSAVLRTMGDGRKSDPISLVRYNEDLAREWRNGRRVSFRSLCPQGREGSNPSFRTAGPGSEVRPNAPFAFKSRRTGIVVETIQQKDRRVLRIPQLVLIVPTLFSPHLDRASYAVSGEKARPEPLDVRRARRVERYPEPFIEIVRIPPTRRSMREDADRSVAIEKTSDERRKVRVGDIDRAKHQALSGLQTHRE